MEIKNINYNLATKQNYKRKSLKNKTFAFINLTDLIGIQKPSLKTKKLKRYR